MSKGKQTLARPRRKRQVIRVACDALLYTTAEGEQAPLRAGQWVEFYARLSGADIIALAEFSALAHADDGAIDTLGPQFAALIKFLASKIAAWSWLDIDGDYAPLPPPTPEVLAALDIDDLMALLDMYASMTEPAPKA